MRSALLAIAIALVLAPTALAAGETTHAWMAERAVDHLPAGDLKTLLDPHRLDVMSGAGYPDTGYWVDGYVPDEHSHDFGEESHWERFINEYVAYIREKDCGPNLADPLGPCARLVAHLMGSAAHGLGDEVWDWLFEPRITDHGEDAGKNFFAPGRPGEPLAGNPLDEISGSPEYAMDEVAIWFHNRWVSPNTMPPPVTDLVEIYKRRDLNVSPAHILLAHAASFGGMAGERAVAAEEGPRVTEDMPWSSANFITAPGGVEWSAHAIAGYYEALWRKLTAPDQAVPKVVSIYPVDGATGVPTQWQPAKTAPGPASGGGDLRIWAALGHAVDPASVTPDSFKLLDADGEPVPPRPGFPRPGPWGADGGTHSLLFYPDVDLEPCSAYTAVLTTGLKDLSGLPLEAEKRWSFRTACGQ
jgi:hypothetical protein